MSLRRFTAARNRLLFATVMMLTMLAFASCGSSESNFDPADFDPLTSVPVEISVSSPDISEGETIPARFTCDGENRAPVISWQRPPNGTQAVAVIFDDPDAPGGIFPHWVVFNLPPEENRLDGSTVAESGALADVLEGVNGFEEQGYSGPCPPSGETHEYRFNVFAMIAPLALQEGATASEVLAAMRGSVIGHGSLSASYTRP